MNKDHLITELRNLEADYHQALMELVAIPSVIDETDSNAGAPFGKNISLALKKTVEICEKLGFHTYFDPEGYYGYAEIGEGPEMIGVLGHLDIVPAGKLDEWLTPPFVATIKDGNMYGRGTQDDKGPTLAAVFAVKALMNLGATFPKRVRFIFGTDEESLWRCMKRYCEIEEIPSLGFAPDSVFPLVYAEKGLLQLNLESTNETPLRLTAGNAFNAVPDTASYNGEKQQELITALEELGYSYERNEGSVVVVGRAVHAQVAEKGINAITRLLMALKQIGYTSKTIDFIHEIIKEDPYALEIFGDCQDEASGKLKFNIGKVELNDEVERLSIDIRFPVTVAKEIIVTKLTTAAAAYGLTYKEYDYLKSIYVPKDHFLIKTLMKVYQDVTGDLESEPISSGGATYARAMDNFVSFGAIFPNQIKTEHQPNEHIELEEMFKAMIIYANAIFQLTR
ncbi:Sapep family Mn(2+)-dependent dipeptidase [Bacillus sp. BRMEA1]|uniref:M20 family metallopeptidase n=1 Tax=Neobacillus endophyticus TaxID=2738405 RepID=UPI001564E182|nr:M20 family metallopeptidase [Neobacillus endophyticus]NRD76461.1 Sapep family Mn(2+)-dependent dipeptidase [Neobacillus endophyticus]